MCLSVCLRAYLRSHTSDLYQIFCACCLWRGWVLFGQGDKIPRGRGNFGFFFYIDNAMIRVRCIWDRPGSGDGSAQRGRSVVYDCLVSSYFSLPFITFCVSRRRCKMSCGHARLSVCLSVCPRPHAHTTARTRM